MAKRESPAMNTFVYQAIEAINKLVETCDFDDAHYGIAIVRKHLEARAEQTAPQADPDEDLL